MKDLPIGLNVGGATAPEVIAGIAAAERAGLHTAWLTGGAPGDLLALFAAAARETSRIGLGTAIVTTFPRHPIALRRRRSSISSHPAACAWASDRVTSP